MYDISNIIPAGYASKLIPDMLHVASHRNVIDYHQYHYFDYAQNFENPAYIIPIQFSAAYINENRYGSEFLRMKSSLDLIKI